MRAWLWAALGLLVIGGGGYVVYKARGLRNNNPGNLEGDLHWDGQTGVDDKGYAVFSSWQKGMRALMINLRNQQALHGLDTISAILNQFAPSSENDTPAYIDAVSRDMGIDPQQRINLRDPKILSAFAQAVTKHENGLQPYNVALVDDIAKANV